MRLPVLAAIVMIAFSANSLLNRMAVVGDERMAWLTLHRLLGGAVTSEAGQAVRYRALQQLPAAPAAIAQLAVPVNAAAGGTIFLGEEISLRLVPSVAVVLTGIGLSPLR